ncbi:HD-GYP domain-containing protein [Natranaerofaba carboxydovora]|uniref:HD-GYP domain-containing protein n=1 Tax=Natranaerofaba carboxydovora TaxID=2742683 RepID=UPI001F147954|nr:HD domain-containing phosphohydrolase [Natranaerofaba carboxydovora]UMZ74217.1 Cyclic di-GMP phosphodiesterase response regulator RpfG [Natranaerofaba carboxydovora]
MHNVLKGFLLTIQSKDNYTAAHSYRVAHFSIELANLFGLKPLKLKALKTSALLHDLGKLAVPDSVLNKKSSLTDSEFDLIKKHPRIGVRGSILKLKFENHKLNHKKFTW